MGISKLELIQKSNMSSEITLHENFEEVLLKYAGTICYELMQLRGLYEIDHFSINIIDPRKRLLVFSLLPSVEQSLFLHGLWMHDKSFLSSSLQNGEHKFFAWREGYDQNHQEQLILHKETKHGFSLGFSINTKLNDFEYIYSFATRSRSKGLLEQYKTIVPNLLKIGAHGYKRIHHIHKLYIDEPKINPLKLKASRRLYLIK